MDIQDGEGNVAVEHLAGPFTLSDFQRCVRCNILLGAGLWPPRDLVPIYSDVFGEAGRFQPYEPVWIYDGVIWPVSPDPEKTEIIFCGASH